MHRWQFSLVRTGRMHGLGALALAGLFVAIVVSSTGGQSAIAARLAISGLVLVALALAVGSPVLVGGSTLPMLGAALVASGSASQPTWVRSIVLGCLWYVAAELAWESIERREGVECTPAFNDRRVNEIANVVVLALCATTAGFAMSSFAPTRSVVAAGLATVPLLIGLTLASQRLNRESAAVQDETGKPV